MKPSAKDSAKTTARPATKRGAKGTARRALARGVSLSTKLVVLIIVLLAVGTAGISLSIRQLVSNYLMDKTDTQLISQADLVFRNTDMLQGSENQNSMTNYYVKAYNAELDRSTVLLQPVYKDGIISSPDLPDNGDLDGETLGVPFTVDAVVSLKNVQKTPDHSTLETAEAPWRVVAFRWGKTTGTTYEDTGIVYVGLSLANQIDTINTLTKFCVLVGIAVVLLGGVLSAIVVEKTLSPLKRIEKTAAKIAAGDLSQRIPTEPENTEVGSLSKSLNTMLSTIEQSFKEQEAVTDKMKQFVSDASHELRTPLAAIHGYAELYKMQRDLPDALERADDSIAHIEASSSRMTVLVEDLLSLARLDEGRGVNATQPIRMSSVLQDSVDDLHALDPERAIGTGTLALDDADGKPKLGVTPGPLPDVTVVADGTRIHQVVTNIVGNIHRYTPADSPVEFSLGVVGIDMTPRDMSKLKPNEQSLASIMQAAERYKLDRAGVQYAVARFADHGPGVPDESRAKIFERFYTADPSRARQKGGTGLGMAIVLAVVKSHCGFICATETPGGGLSYTMFLPLTQDFRGAAPQRDAHQL
ncbi:HAMP domain-containing sensor histidine kinase [Bifidobacterium choloepi]|uniref:histidine kinase n=1 Tax=Bifidobacterium choloepi TaxID=2614131 RepID=A0A6I5MYL8_9BIFI|nr:HAMP domain-containing sensor histidine kinase [Bifidobacterium choloepi]NEG69367.1 HAMP domain-containing histidine kinase [Bifidobacterium choloepi]